MKKKVAQVKPRKAPEGFSNAEVEALVNMTTIMTARPLLEFLRRMADAEAAREGAADAAVFADLRAELDKMETPGHTGSQLIEFKGHNHRLALQAAVMAHDNPITIRIPDFGKKKDFDDAARGVLTHVDKLAEMIGTMYRQMVANSPRLFYLMSEAFPDTDVGELRVNPHNRVMRFAQKDGTSRFPFGVGVAMFYTDTAGRPLFEDTTAQSGPPRSGDEPGPSSSK